MKHCWILFAFSCCFTVLTSCQSNNKTVMNAQQLQQLSEQQIIDFNQQSCARQDRYEVLASVSHKLQSHLDQITASLPNSINGRPLNYRVYLNTQPGAWSTLNGCIRVTSGLLKNFTNNEIQAVLAHEIGHIALNHSIKSFRAAKSAEIMNNGEIFLFTPQSLTQQQELDADQFAINLLNQYHINPNGLISMMNKLNHHQKQASLSHPDIIARKNAIINKVQSLSINTP